MSRCLEDRACAQSSEWGSPLLKYNHDSLRVAVRYHVGFREAVSNTSMYCKEKW